MTELGDLEVVFSNAEVTIYRVRALSSSASE